MAMQETIVEAGGGMRQYWRDLWKYRELIGILAWRDLSVRYKQAVLGIAWSALRPITTTLVFTIVFGKLAKFPSAGAPYPIIVLSGLLAWQFFASALESTSGSIIGNSNLVGKVYFPRLVIPLSALAVSLVDMLVNLALLIAVMAWYQYLPSARVFLLPIFLLFTALLTLGLGFWLSALSAKYRDFRILVPFVIQLGFYASPVGFSSSVVPAAWRFWFDLNPMVGLIDGARWCLQLNVPMPGLSTFLASGLATAFFFVTGLFFFRAREREFADVF